MPRADVEASRRAIRAYHRASAALRELHREEWEALRASLLDSPNNNGAELLKPGPSKGARLFAASYRVASQEDLVDARQLIEEVLDGTSKAPARAVLRAFTAAGFLLMRSTPSSSTDLHE